MRMPIFAAAVLALSSAAGFAQSGAPTGHPAGHGGHGAPAAASAAPSTKAFQDANMAMHKGMDITFTGDADVDFVRGMIPHHQGAIDMAKVALAHGKDAETRKLAQEIIAAQEKEIAWMKQWLAAKGK